MIRLQHGIEFNFEKVSSPKKQANKILQLRSRFVSEKNIEDQNSLDDSKKFDVLVEAL